MEGYNNPELEKITIEASCPTGFEGAAAEEVKKKFQAENVIDGVMGRVLFDVPLDNVKDVLQLRTVDNVWAIFGATTGT